MSKKVIKKKATTMTQIRVSQTPTKTTVMMMAQALLLICLEMMVTMKTRFISLFCRNKGRLSRNRKVNI